MKKISILIIILITISCMPVVAIINVALEIIAPTGINISTSYYTDSLGNTLDTIAPNQFISISSKICRPNTCCMGWFSIFYNY